MTLDLEARCALEYGDSMKIAFQSYSIIKGEYESMPLKNEQAKLEEIFPRFNMPLNLVYFLQQGVRQ